MYEAIIIDDEKWVVTSLLSTIKSQEYFEINEVFHNGLLGLEYIRNKQPVLAFVDIGLPGMGGLDILQTIHSEHIDTLFIIISGHAEFAYAQKAMLHNAIGYCLKPFSRSELMDSMQKAYTILENRKKQDSIDHPISTEEVDNIFRPQHLTSSHQSIQAIINYTESHYMEDMSIQDLAEQYSINANYASHLFKQETGNTFVSYLTGLRIDHASWLLQNTDSTVFLIASKVGYSDYFYFAKVFKKITGLTPTAYRTMYSSDPLQS